MWRLPGASLEMTMLGPWVQLMGSASRGLYQWSQYHAGMDHRARARALGGTWGLDWATLYMSLLITGTQKEH